MTIIGIWLAALADSAVTTPRMQGMRLKAGSTCYQIMAGDKPVGTTLQTIARSRHGGRQTWDIIVHQKLANGGFDLRDHFVVDRSTLAPIKMESERGRSRDAKGWHRIALDYSPTGIEGRKETATEMSRIHVPLSGPIWDGNLWGISFAALPLRAGGAYTIPFWQYDKGFGIFTVRVVGSKDVGTPSGKMAAWIVEAGSAPDALIRYTISKSPRQEIGYESSRGGQRIGGSCN